MSYIDDMVKRINARINNSKLGQIKRALPSVQWLISGDSGYWCITDEAHKRQFRLYDSGRLFFLCDYKANVGAWGDYTKRIEITDLDAMMQRKDWYQTLLYCKKENRTPDVIIL